VEAGIFRSGLYLRYLQPNSTTGDLEYNLYWLRQYPATPKPPQGEVLVVGDSRLAEGFSALHATEESKGRILFRNVAVGGMSVRNWYFLIRDADRHRKRFKAIVLGLDAYADNEALDSPPDRIGDLNYSIGRLRLTDCWDFAMSMKTPQRQRTALSGCLFKGLVFRADFHEFLSDPAKRIELAKQWHLNGLGWGAGYPGIERSLTGLSADFAKGAITFPPTLEEPVRATVRQTVTPNRPSDFGENTRYRKLWLGRIIDLYRGNPTKIIFVEMPRAPLPIPESKVPRRFIESVSSEPGVVVMPAATYRDLERPDLFGDGLHLNSVGRPLFSVRLAHDVLHILGME
jgi:hypothetical protein